MIQGKQIDSILSAIRDLFSRWVNGKQCIGSQTIDITNTLKSLTVPAGATEALIMVEPNATGSAGTSTTPVARWSISDIAPQGVTYNGTQEGMPVVPMAPFTIRGAEALRAFRIISINNVTGAFGLKVIYFK